MIDKKNYLLKKVKPLMFSDGNTVFRQFMEDYIVHSKGLFIVAPSGAGKTHFVKSQTEKHWIDGDDLWIAAGAHPKTEWWTQGLDVIFEVDQRSDIVTVEAKKLGLWILGASNYWLKPDGIVLPDWEIQQQYIISRESNNYDGGAKSSDFEQVLGHRKTLLEQADRDNIPVFSSIKIAIEELTKNITVPE